MDRQSEQTEREGERPAVRQPVHAPGASAAYGPPYAADQPPHGPAPYGPPPYGPALGDLPETLQGEPATAAARDQLTAIRLRAERAASWRESARHYARLINAEGHVPVTARFRADDLAFLGRAREEVLSLTELGLRLAGLHQPLDAAEPDTARDDSGTRCRNCMWRWPCPTFRVMAEILGRLDQD